jgi:predicted house-cleaning NTP pyrophosphatase (Maf/HAM1 superfamily)
MILLASRSASRAAMLRAAGVDFEQVRPNWTNARWKRTWPTLA